MISEIKCHTQIVCNGIIKVSRFYPCSVLILNNTNIFRKLLLNRLFQSSHRPKLKETFSEFIHTRILYSFQSSFKLILIFSESYYPIIHIFHMSNKPLLTNKTIKAFSEFISNNINIFRELL